MTSRAVEMAGDDQLGLCQCAQDSAHSLSEGHRKSDWVANVD